jgi:hypothetical protein
MLQLVSWLPCWLGTGVWSSPMHASSPFRPLRPDRPLLQITQGGQQPQTRVDKTRHGGLGRCMFQWRACLMDGPSGPALKPGHLWCMRLHIYLRHACGFMQAQIKCANSAHVNSIYA